MYLPFARGGDEEMAMIPIVLFAGLCLWGIVHSIAFNWRKAKESEHQAILKQQMLDRGMSVAEIERILNAGGGPPTPAA